MWSAGTRVFLIELCETLSVVYCVSDGQKLLLVLTYGHYLLDDGDYYGNLNNNKTEQIALPLCN